MPQQRVNLGELISEVTRQIREAAADADDKDHVMRFQECEVETTMTVESQAGGGARLWVAELRARRRKTDSNAVRLRFTNLPERPVLLPVVAEPPKPGGHPD